MTGSVSEPGCFTLKTACYANADSEGCGGYFSSAHPFSPCGQKQQKKWTIKVREERHLHASFTHEDPTTMKCGEIYSCPPSHYNRRHTVGG